MDRISATYLIETPLPVELAAASLAGEQSSGTFIAVPGETEELKQRFAARVEKITPLETVNSPALPGVEGRARHSVRVVTQPPRDGAQRTDAPYQRAEVV